MLLFALLICLIHSVIGVPQVWFQKQTTCGISKYPDAGEYELPKPFIVGGIEARRHEFPWQVRLNWNRNFLCGGSIINDRWILTVAHCTERLKPNYLTLYLGDHKRNENNNTNRLNVSVEKIINHPNYDFPFYDISLIKTSQSINLNENVWPICLPKPNNQYIYEKTVISGWGSTVTDGKPSDILMYTTLNTTTNEYCQRFHERVISDDMICATDNKNDIERSGCHTDSGGPLAVKDSNGIFSIIGVVSWLSPDGCANGSMTVFSRVNYVLDWINETIENCNSG